MNQQHISRPNLHESFTLVLMMVFAWLPALAFLINDVRAALIVFAVLALSFWPPIGQIIAVTVRNRKAGRGWKWPRVVGGPSFQQHYGKRQV